MVLTLLVSRSFVSKYDRYFSRTPECNVWPFRHRTIKNSVYWVLIIAIWLTTLLFCALIMNYYYKHKLDYYYYAWGSFISICLLVICVSYVFIFVKLRFGNQPRHHGTANSERKLTVTLFTVTSLSLLLWLPYVITTFRFFATDILSSFSEIALFRLLRVSVVLLYANSFFNPILYTMRMPGFRRALKVLCRQRPQPHRQVQIIPLHKINPQNWIILTWEKWTWLVKKCSKSLKQL